MTDTTPDARVDRAADDAAPDGVAHLRLIYRWALKAYPRSYMAEHGDDLVGVLADARQGESKASLREAGTLVVAGFGRRAATVRSDVVGFLAAATLTAEAAFGILVLIFSISRIESHTGGGIFGLHIAWRLVTATHLVPLLAFELVVAAATLTLLLAARQEWRLVGARADGDGGVALARGVVRAQPVVLPVACGAATGFFSLENGAPAPNAPLWFVLMFVGGLIAGTVLTRYSRHSYRSGPVTARTAGWSVGVVTLLLAALFLSGLRLTIGRDLLPNIPAGPTRSFGTVATGFQSVTAIPTGGFSPTGLACSDEGGCAITGMILEIPTKGGEGGEGVVVPTNGASPAVVHDPSANGDFVERLLLSSMTCPAPGSCDTAAISGGFLRWSQGLLTAGAWPSPVSAIGGPALACPSVKVCVLGTSSSLDVTLDAGGRWTPVPLRLRPQTGGDLVGVACPSTRVCLAGMETLTLASPVDRTSLTITETTDGGRKWVTRTMQSIIASRSKIGDTTANGGEIACSSVHHCILLSNLATTSRLWRTTNGGRTWRSASIPLPHGTLGDDASVVCAPAGSCFLVPSGTAGRIWAISADGHRWTPERLPDELEFGTVLQGTDGGASHNAAGILSCTSATSCTAIATHPDQNARNRNYLVTTTNSGRTWTVHSMPTLPSATARPPCKSAEPVHAAAPAFQREPART